MLQLTDINKALEKVQYVIFTSKVTCGCDHTNPWDKFYIDAGGTRMGCTSRDLLQQMGTFRLLKDKDVLVLISSHRDKRTKSTSKAFSNIIADLEEKRRLLQTKYENLLSFDVLKRDGDLVLSPD